MPFAPLCELYYISCMENLAAPKTLSVKEQNQLKKDLVKYHLYRVMGFVFSFLGLFIFILLYIKFVDGDIEVFMRKPMIMVILLVPFLPTFLFLYMAQSSREKANKFLEEFSKPDIDPDMEMPTSRIPDKDEVQQENGDAAPEGKARKDDTKTKDKKDAKKK